jgi:hypothetical protein
LGAGHVATCEECQAFFSTCDELDLALTRDAAREWQEAPTNLEQNILRVVRLQDDRRREPTAARASRLLGWTLTGAVACLALAIVARQDRFVPVRGPADPVAHVAAPPAAVSSDPAVLEAARQFIAAVPTDLFDEMRPRAQAVLQQDPLQNEVAALKSDARLAVRFLALNFLPASIEEATRGE